MYSSVVIVDAARTPIGSFNGSLSSLKAHDLCSPLIEQVLKRNSVDPCDVSEVILGQSLQAGQGQNPARQSSINAKIPYTVPSFTVNQLCGSGLKSVVLGCQSILTDSSIIVLCGGQESMSQSPHCVHMRKGTVMGSSNLIDTMICDGLTDAFDNIHMGVTAENVARKYNISREDQDKFAYESHMKTVKAQQENLFEKEIIPIKILSKSNIIEIFKDESPRPDTNKDKLSKLRPVFSKDESATVTAGNSSSINDGAAIILLMAEDEAKLRNIKPLAKILSYAEVGVEPSFMGIGPVGAVYKVLEKCGLNIDDINLFELNEAFASQSLAVIKELNLNSEKVNVHGGAIALGHPIGASGARILVTLLYALEHRNLKRGIASLCIGGGMGIAMAVERV